MHRLNARWLRRLSTCHLRQAVRIHTPKSFSSAHPCPANQQSPAFAPSDLTSAIKSFDATLPVAQALTPPSSWFIDPRILELEKRTVFSSNWIHVGRLDQVSNAGDFFTGTIGPEPYIVVRGEDNQLRAFYNVCRHHAAAVATSPSGNANCFQCPYHGWTYDTFGRLIKATRLKGIQNFAAKNFGLVPMEVKTFGPLVFVRCAKNGESLTQEFPKPLNVLTDRLESLGFAKGFKFYTSKSWDLNCNWKVFVDNYLDGGYHVAHLHKGLGSLLDLQNYKTEVFDGYSIQSVPAAVSSSEESRVGKEALYIYIYPNLMINRYGPLIETNTVFPISSDKCRVLFDYMLEETFVPPTPYASTKEYMDMTLKASDIVQEEDIGICEAVQRGLHSSSYVTGRYAPSVEHADYHFHQLLSQDLNRAVSSSSS
eukprot:GILK01005214.1.p1 GENE.GILK01005214.1~~GILK01005214.1.p1  ORF type:complete len:425 (+),score=34.09 GILK01005214.1:64-1338(+)